MTPTETAIPHRSPPRAGPTDENAFRAFIRTFGLLDRVMHPYFARHGISGAQWGVLRTIHRAEQDGARVLRMTELSDRLIIRPASVTGVVDRLVRDGLVKRTAQPTDLRVKHIQLTPKGRDLVDRVLAGHEGQIARVLGGLSAGEQTEFQRLLVRLGHHLESLDRDAVEGTPPCASSSESSSPS